jgi:hypothetical protein
MIRDNTITHNFKVTHGEAGKINEAIQADRTLVATLLDWPSKYNMRQMVIDWPIVDVQFRMLDLNTMMVTVEFDMGADEE